MKSTVKVLLFACTMASVFVACKKDAKDITVQDGVSEATKAQIKSLGFGTQDAKKVKEGYLVEGDIILTQQQLDGGMPSSPNMVIANEEHYHTFYMVSPSKHPIIKVAFNNSSTQHQASFSAALDESIRRYNAENLTVSFQRVSTGADVTVVAFYEVSNTLGSSGFPNSAGDPYNQVQM
ncbi:MAG: M57 family metalloprotease, partial [Bacteroidota bacterium]|nr:M57 family metalloprotease [Bacteroidota bacterium]